jgi:DNA replication licensing factor MCM4
VEITGIYRAMGVRVNPNRRTLKNIYRTYIDVICYKKTDRSRVNLNDKDAARNEQMLSENVEMQDANQGDHLVQETALNHEH